MLLQVTMSLSLRISPSAYQIRYGGCKGVVSLWPELEDDQLRVRKSMEKFQSDHHELEVVQYTKPGDLVPLFLFHTLSHSGCVVSTRHILMCKCPVVIGGRSYSGRVGRCPSTFWSLWAAAISGPPPFEPRFKHRIFTRIYGPLKRVYQNFFRLLC